MNLNILSVPIPVSSAAGRCFLSVLLRAAVSLPGSRTSESRSSEAKASVGFPTFVFSSVPNSSSSVSSPWGDPLQHESGKSHQQGTKERIPRVPAIRNLDGFLPLRVKTTPQPGLSNTPTSRLVPYEMVNHLLNPLAGIFWNQPFETDPFV